MEALPSLSEVEADARRMQAAEVAKLLRAFTARLRDALGGAMVHGTGRTA